MMLTYIRFKRTALERITNIAIKARAYRHMALYSTISIYTTRPWTGIHTFFIDTGQLIRTVCVNGTFWTTIWWTTRILW